MASNEHSGKSSMIRTFDLALIYLHHQLGYSTVNITWTIESGTPGECHPAIMPESRTARIEILAFSWYVSYHVQRRLQVGWRHNQLFHWIVILVQSVCLTIKFVSLVKSVTRYIHVCTVGKYFQVTLWTCVSFDHHDRICLMVSTRAHSPTTLLPEMAFHKRSRLVRLFHALESAGFVWTSLFITISQSISTQCPQSNNAGVSGPGSSFRDDAGSHASSRATFSSRSSENSSSSSKRSRPKPVLSEDTISAWTYVSEVVSASRLRMQQMVWKWRMEDPV